MASVAEFLSLARAQIGDPYRWGHEGPDSFDCSGLVQYSLKALGISAPRTARAQWSWVDHVTEPAPGDLVFTGKGGTPTHVMIYAGDGKVVEAPRTGLDVRERAWSPGSDLIGYGRVPGLGGAAGGALSGLMQLALPDSALKVFDTMGDALRKVMWWFNPENWVRITSGVFGVILAAFAVMFLLKASAD